MRELEATIDANPDDVEAYYVYGDWLQTQGDPRGELIALQAAQARDPSDKRLAARIDRYLDKHADALLGPLHARERKELSLVWRYGFVRDARIGADGDTFEILRDLVRHPSGRFMQSITITARTLDIDAVVALLLEHARPPTLAELRINGLDEARVEALRAVFPRLNRALDVEWRRILESITKRRKIDVPFDLKKLPPLEHLPNVAIGELDPQQLVLGLRHEIDKGEPLGIVAAMKRTFSAGSLDRFAIELARQHVGLARATTKWSFRALVQFGGNLAASWIADNMTAWSWGRADYGIHLLGEIGTDHAVIELAAIATDRRLDRERRQTAKYALSSVAHRRSLGDSELVDRAMPAELTPRARDAVVRRLVAHMVDGRRLSARELRRYFATHPGVAPLAERIVWATYAGARVTTTFRLTGERAFGPGGEPVDLDGRIGALHPAELARADRAALVEAWRETFDALGIEPLFPQLDRASYDQELNRFASREVGFDQLRAVLEHQRDWTPVYEHQWTANARLVAWSKQLPRTEVTATATHAGGAITSVTLAERGIAVTLADVDPVGRWELLDDLETATTRAGATEASDVAEATIEKGTRVRIVRGAGRGKHGLVFWLGEGKAGGRCGVRGDDDETYWADLEHVVIETAPDPEPDDASDDPVYGKGDRVRWVKGKTSGTGTVFWTGRNKFGDGMRVGVKSDADGETVWLDAKDCALE